MEGHKFWETLLLIILLILLRFVYLIYKITTGHSRKSSQKRIKPAVTLICIGSGGHTTEMISLLNSIDFKKYKPRYYVIASSDKTSLNKIEEIEKLKGSLQKYWNVIYIPRSRKVLQSYISSIFTTIISILYSIPVVIKTNPDLILCNGPGTCVPICLVAFLLKAMFIKDIRIVFIESICRTKTLSLTGKILLYIADNFIVQWPSLGSKYRRAEYIGQLM